MFGCRRNLKNQEHANMGHVKSKGTDLQNTKTFKDSKHKEHEHKPKPNPQSLTNLEHPMKNQTPHTNIKPRKKKKPINFKPKFEKPINKPRNFKHTDLIETH